MNPRSEATARLDGRYDPRVLEPSPPAVTAGPWFADDPVDPEYAPTGLPVVSPVASTETTWEQLVAGDPELAAWTAERWLAGLRPLGPAPARLPETRRALHRLAEQVISPARRLANTKIGLRWTRGGFGTPWFAPERQLRVDGDVLVIVDGDQEHRAPIRSLTAAAQRLGPGWLPDDVTLDDAPLPVDAAAAAFIGDWFGFATHVLETLRAGAGPDSEPSRVQLWPEHFDLALELGSASSGARAAYGLSPGDDAHDEPYLYVAPWQAPEPSPLWRAESFAGAELSYASLLAAADQRDEALSFFRARLDALTRG